MKQICKNCEHWKSQQAELNYWDMIGFCIIKEYSFSVSAESKCSVYDELNKLPPKHRQSHDFEAIWISNSDRDVEKSRYKLVTRLDFGCINFKEDAKNEKV